MKTKKEFYQVKLKIFLENHNTIRVYETNEIDVAKSKFHDMEKAIKETAHKEWILTLNAVHKNNVNVIALRSSAGQAIDSPLY